MLVRGRIDYEGIEAEARKLQIDLWDRQCALLPDGTAQPLDVCSPYVAAKHLGFEI